LPQCFIDTEADDLSPVSSPKRVSGRTSRGSKSTGGSHSASLRRRQPRWTLARIKSICGHIVEHRLVIAFTTALTVYALTGDDLKLILTNKDADTFFNIVVMFCLGVFSLEIVLSCLGKEDYFGGFFFVLDVVSTASLLLDISWISDELLEDSGKEGDASSARAGRTARIGAKAGRVVRVIRLVRILKLYKGILDARAAQKHEAKKHPLDDDDWGDVEVPDGQRKGANQESFVGKKLSDLTTRRVIVLVLTMLLVLPFLQTQETAQSPLSANYGADLIWEAWLDFRNGLTSQSRYEQEFLLYAYYHNWFAKEQVDYCPSGACSDLYESHLFWVGMTGKDEAAVSAAAQAAQLSLADVAQWVQVEEMQDAGIYNLGRMPPEIQAVFASPWEEDCPTTTGQRRVGISLLKEDFAGLVGHTVRCPEDLRLKEFQVFFPRRLSTGVFDEAHMVFYFDMRPYIRMDAAFNLGITAFVCLVLCVASLMFSSDAARLVLTPVENMIKKVESIRDDPLSALQMADEEFRAEEIQKAKKRRQALNRELLSRCMDGLRGGKQEPMETVVLEKTIIKLGSLLALGLGEAGTNIIGQNMRGSASAGVNAMIPGSHVECLIGVVRVLHFSTAVEVLREKIMTFVNQIAEIVHGVSHEYHGATNKNNGDSFLIIWRLHQRDPEVAQRMADMSLLAFAKILGAVHRSPLLARYRRHPGLQQRLQLNSRVDLTFGLHSGWAIEGAVGSEFKIDASYLSPNVSLANSLETASRVYKVPLVASEVVINLCSPKMASKCRLIDRVIVKGSARPLELYSLDLDPRCLTVDDSAPPKFTWNSRNRFKAREFLEEEKQRKLNANFEVASLFEADPHLIAMRARYSTSFIQQHSMGYQNYSEGEWEVARKMLTKALHMLTSGSLDGPSEALLDFMETFGWNAPKGWAGTRSIDSLLLVE